MFSGLGTKDVEARADRGAHKDVTQRMDVDLGTTETQASRRNRIPIRWSAETGRGGA